MAVEPPVPDDEPSGIPPWVKISGIVALVAIVLLVLVLLIQGGQHGPARHGATAAGAQPHAALRHSE